MSNDGTADGTAALTKQGFIFQDAIALYFFVTNILSNKNNGVKKVTSEGVYEDIEIYFNDDSCSLFQVKYSKYNLKPLTDARLKNGLKVLVKDLLDVKNNKINELALVSNSNHPILDKNGSKEFSLNHINLKYKSLTSKEKAKIDRTFDKIKKLYSKDYPTISIEKEITELRKDLSVIKVFYHSDDDDDNVKMQQIKGSLDEIIGKMGLININNILIDHWKILFTNVSTKPEKAVTPKIFAGHTEMCVMNNKSSEEKRTLMSEINIGRDYRSYIENNYGDYLKFLVSDMDIRPRIMKDFNAFKKSYQKQKIFSEDRIFIDFIQTKSSDYMNELGMNLKNEDSNKQLAKFIVASLIDNAKIFNDIEGVLSSDN